MYVSILSAVRPYNIVDCIGKETEVYFVVRFNCCWNVVGCGPTFSEVLVFKSSFDCYVVLCCDRAIRL